MVSSCRAQGHLWDRRCGNPVCMEIIRPANLKVDGAITQTLLGKRRRRHWADTGHTPRDPLPGKTATQTRAHPGRPRGPRAVLLSLSLPAEGGGSGGGGGGLGSRRRAHLSPAPLPHPLSSWPEGFRRLLPANLSLPLQNFYDPFAEFLRSQNPISRQRCLVIKIIQIYS